MAAPCSECRGGSLHDWSSNCRGRKSCTPPSPTTMWVSPASQIPEHPSWTAHIFPPAFNMGAPCYRFVKSSIPIVWSLCIGSQRHQSAFGSLVLHPILSAIRLAFSFFLHSTTLSTSNPKDKECFLSLHRCFPHR